MERRGFAVALPAVLGAASLSALFAGSALPGGKWGLCALAGLGPCAAVASAGIPAGLLCWGGAGLLGAVLLPDRLCVLLFAAVFGPYPMVKAAAERLARPAAWAVKLVFCSAALTLTLWLGGGLLALPPRLLEGAGRAALYAGVNGVFCVYDLGLTRLICFYLARVDRAVRRMARR